jgi:hypothetical protein
VRINLIKEEEGSDRPPYIKAIEVWVYTPVTYKSGDAEGIVGGAAVWWNGIKAMSIDKRFKVELIKVRMISGSDDVRR